MSTDLGGGEVLREGQEKEKIRDGRKMKWKREVVNLSEEERDRKRGRRETRRETGRGEERG